MSRAPRILVVALALWVAFPSVATQPPVGSAKWITLGTAGGPPLHADQAQISNALVVGDAVYLFDCGNGVLRQMDAAGLSIRNVRAVFLSHHHLDHFQVPPSVSPASMPDALADRVEAGGRSFVYTGDTGPSQNLRMLARGADVLITEVVDLEAIDGSLRRMQGIPAGVVQDLVAGMAKNHPANFTRGIAPTYKGPVAIAKDLDTF